MRRLEKQIFGFLIVAALVFSFAAMIPAQVYVWIGVAAAVAALFWIISKFKREPEKYINDRGYVVLAKENELEHRYIAKQLLGRDLAQNEIVHHINGSKTDNDVRNLCLMDSEKHEHFHAWLRWKREKDRRYPHISHQKRVLVEEYGGTLLENIKPLPQIAPMQNENAESEDKNRVDSEIFIVRRNKASGKMFVEYDEEVLISPDGKDVELDTDRFGEPEEVTASELTANQITACQNKTKSRTSAFAEEEKQLDLRQRLFNELRKERMRLARERGVPAYIVFDDKTLIEIAETMPVSESLMLQIRGVGPVKLRLYGAHFINVVKKFKNVW